MLTIYANTHLIKFVIQLFEMVLQYQYFQNSGSCFLNKHPCFDKFGIGIMTFGSWRLQFSNHILIIQKFFFGEIVIPLSNALCSRFTVSVSPHSA